MIRYALACDSGHCFESWFRDSAAFDDQRARGLVSCLACGSPHVAKTIMAPAVVSRRVAQPPTIEGHMGKATTVAGPPVAPAAPASPRAEIAAPLVPVELALLDGRQREMRALARAFRDKVLAESRDVGTNFSAQARRMHDGEIPEQQIRGKATLGEARDLLEDGILVLPLPSVPDDMN